VVGEEMIKLLRRQRHDFINHIQVVHAYLQLGKIEKALAFLEELAKDTNKNDFFMKYTCQEECSKKADKE
jgi:sensor histidine kinase regulating citrate/malate metabolism